MTGVEWIVEAYGCEPERLADPRLLDSLFTALIEELGLHPVRPAVWHQFPAPGGCTGLVLLAESHLACHTFPEFGSICLNLFCCRERREWDFDAELRHRLGADSVLVRRLERNYVASSAAVKA